MASEKRNIDELSETEEAPDKRLKMEGFTESITVSRTGRVRKKSNKLLEMEQGEDELEEAMRPIDSKRARKKSTKVIENEQAEILEKVMRSPNKKKGPKTPPETSRLQLPGIEPQPSTIKMLLSSPAKPPDVPPSSAEKSASMRKSKPKKERAVEPVVSMPGDASPEAREIPSLGVNIVTSPIKSPSGTPALLSMMAGHTPLETAVVKTEKSRKKKKKELEKKETSPIVQTPLAQSLLSPTQDSPPPPILELEVPMEELEDEGELVIDTPKETTRKPKPKKRSEKKSPKVSSSGSSMGSPQGGSGTDRGADMVGSSPPEGTESGEGSPPPSASATPVYSNTQKMGLKLMTSREKKANKDKKGRKKVLKEDALKPKKKRAPTAYMLWCNSRRAQLVEDNPGIDFASISKKLGEIWQSQPEKEKLAWKRKAKKAAAKGSTLISTGKAGRTSTPAAPTSTIIKPGSGATSAPTKAPSSHTPVPAPAQAVAISSQSSTMHKATEGTSTQIKGCGISPVDAAAHLKLLGESLSIIGARLQEHRGQIAVQGSLSVLLDTVLCALAPLTCLTALVPEADGCPLNTHRDTLNNVAYYMPGIG